MDRSETRKWDPQLTQQVKRRLAPVVNGWFRADVRGMDRLPATGGALVVSNHSGGALTPDVIILAHAFYDHFGYGRPLYTLAHSGLLIGPWSKVLRRLGGIEANRTNAAAALDSGGVVLVFPGGDYDAYRPTSSRNTIDFNGRTGYVSMALECGVPIVPTVSIGAQESQLFLTRGTWLARQLGLEKFRTKILPLSFGIPFGWSLMLPPNLPLPTKVVTQVLKPIDVTEQFGDDPDLDAVDAYIRASMQAALNELARQRRFPIIG